MRIKRTTTLVNNSVLIEYENIPEICHDMTPDETIDYLEWFEWELEGYGVCVATLEENNVQEF